MKKINGSWIELRHNGIPEGKYFNAQIKCFTDEQWREKVKEMASLHMKYIVLMATAYCDDTTPVQTFYPSNQYEKSPLLEATDAMEALFEEADKQNMLIFVSTGFYSPWAQTYENMTREQVFLDSFAAMKEVYNRYGKHPSFYGWYYPDELGIDKYYDEEFISFVNRYSAYAHSLNKDLKTLIAPYGTCRLVADDFFVEQLKRLDIDFVAYQDEVGVMKTTEQDTPTFYKNLKIAHDKANRSKLWADVEVFTFEDKPYKSALIPATIGRLERQLEAVSPYVEEILIFQYEGIFNAPNSKAFCGTKESEKYYLDYMELLNKIENNQ